MEFSSRQVVPVQVHVESAVAVFTLAATSNTLGTGKAGSVTTLSAKDVGGESAGLSCVHVLPSQAHVSDR